MKVFLVVFFLLTFNQVKSQELKNTKYQHQVGLQAGFCTGVGFSYRYWPSKFGIQASFLPINCSDSSSIEVGSIKISNDKNNKFSMGLTGLFKLRQFEHYKLYSYWGNHYFKQGINAKYNSGIGIGFASESIISFNLMFGYGAYDILDRFNLYPTIEFGIYYRFPKH